MELGITHKLSQWNKSVFVLAYTRWKLLQGLNRCYCVNHWRENDFVCERERAWRTYVKVRDGLELNKKEKEQLGVLQ